GVRRRRDAAALGWAGLSVEGLPAGVAGRFGPAQPPPHAPTPPTPQRPHSALARLRVAAAKSGKAEEAPGIARLREQIARGFAYVEDVMYVGLAALLALSALVLLSATALTLGRSVVGDGLPASIVGLRDQLLPGAADRRIALDRARLVSRARADRAAVPAGRAHRRGPTHPGPDCRGQDRRRDPARGLPRDGSGAGAPDRDGAQPRHLPVPAAHARCGRDSGRRAALALRHRTKRAMISPPRIFM